MLDLRLFGCGLAQQLIGFVAIGAAYRLLLRLSAQGWRLVVGHSSPSCFVQAAMWNDNTLGRIDHGADCLQIFLFKGVGVLTTGLDSGCEQLVVGLIELELELGGLRVLVQVLRLVLRNGVLYRVLTDANSVMIRKCLLLLLLQLLGRLGIALVLNSCFLLWHNLLIVLLLPIQLGQPLLLLELKSVWVM